MVVVEGRGSEQKRCIRRPFLQNPYLWLIDNESNASARCRECDSLRPIGFAS